MIATTRPDIAHARDDFVFGVAASAYQTEGRTTADGRGESIWDRFCRERGRIRDTSSGEIACDFYLRYRQDVRLMQRLGVDAFRFSVAWPRVLPEGRGRVNRRGLDFLRPPRGRAARRRHRPLPQSLHWDLPQSLQDQGGWPRRETAEAFAAYAEVVASALGDRVRHWITHNEPFCPAWLGYGPGVHAPGHTSRREALAAAHHLLLSHGWAVPVVRSAAPHAEVGIVLDSWPVFAAGESDEDAARFADGMRNRWFFDPLFRGRYPDDMVASFGDDLPDVRASDLQAIATPLDFVGVNNYSRQFVRADPGGGFPVEVRASVGELTAMGWEIYPRGLGDVLTRLHREYGVQKLYVTESGAAFSDVRTHDGAVHDLDRIAYLDAYLSSVQEAVASGVPVHGYFVWSLLDNFEWAEGYTKRFGLVFVDYPTLERIPKDSFAWYRAAIARAHGSLLAV